MRSFILALLVLNLTSCSSGLKKDEPETFSYATRQLPREERYGTTAWVQPPTVVPQAVDSSGFSEVSDAPLLKPAETPPLVAPKLPAARSRRY
jgi:hypothetical protein